MNRTVRLLAIAAIASFALGATACADITSPKSSCGINGSQTCMQAGINGSQT